MNAAEFSEWITCKERKKERKGEKKKSHKSEFKIPPYGSTFTIKFK